MLPDSVSTEIASPHVLKIAFDSATLSQELRTVDMAVPAITTAQSNAMANVATLQPGPHRYSYAGEPFQHPADQQPAGARKAF